MECLRSRLMPGLGLTGPGTATGEPAPGCRWDTVVGSARPDPCRAARTIVWTARPTAGAA